MTGSCVSGETIKTIDVSTHHLNAKVLTYCWWRVNGTLTLGQLMREIENAATTNVVNAAVRTFFGVGDESTAHMMLCISERNIATSTVIDATVLTSFDVGDNRQFDVRAVCKRKKHCYDYNVVSARVLTSFDVGENSTFNVRAVL